MSPMEPRIQQLRQLDLLSRARETGQTTSPMEALAKMLAKGNIDPRLLEMIPPPVIPRYEEPVPPPPPPRLEEYYSPTTTPFPSQDTATMPMFPDTAPYPTTAPMPNYDIGYDQGATTKPNYEAPNESLYDQPAIYPLDTLAPQMPQLGGVTLSNGQFIAGVPNEQGGVNIGTPDFFQQYAGNPDLMRALSDAYGYDVSQPRPQTTQAPQIGYNEPDVQPQIGYAPETNYGGMNTNSPTTQNPQTNDGRTNDFQKMMEDMRNQQMAENMRNEQRMFDPRREPERPREDPRQDPRINPEPPRPFDIPRDDIGRRLG